MSINDHGDRVKLAYAMTTRERRLWSKRLLDAAEAVEKAQEAMAQLMAQAYDAGVSYATIETASGHGPQTVRNYIRDARGTGEDS